jgi:XapX domain-containing protein
LEEDKMKEVILSLLTGMIVGFLFALLRLPIPAPPALAGVTGIVGIYLGVKLFQWLAPFFPFFK